MRPSATYPTTGGVPLRSGSAKDAGSDTAALGSGCSGAPPPPTRASAVDDGRLDARRVEPCDQGSGPGAQPPRVGVEHLLDRRPGAAQRGLQRGEGRLVHPQGAVERVPAQPLHQFGPPEHQARLRPAEQLVAAGQHQVGAGLEGALQIGLLGQHRMRAEQPGADVGDQRDAGAGQGPGQLAHLDRRG